MPKLSQFQFVLEFSLTPSNDNPERHIDRLHEQGCDDATFEIGEIGKIEADFSRTSNTLTNAVASAIHDVKAAIPGAALAGLNIEGLTAENHKILCGFPLLDSREKGVMEALIPGLNKTS